MKFSSGKFKAKKRFLPLILLFGLSTVRTYADTSINTFQNWNGSTFGQNWGPDGSNAYGQSFTTSSNLQLTDLTFYIKSSDSFSFKAYIYSFDASTRKISGSPLYETNAQSFVGNGSFQAVTVDSNDAVTNETLSSGNFAAFYSVNEPGGSYSPNPAGNPIVANDSGRSQWGKNASDVYAGGTSLYYHTDAHNNGAWTNWGNEMAFILNLSTPDSGDATYSITGQTYAGKTLTAGVSANDPDGNGSVTSYTWQSSSDGSTWNNITGATSSTFTVTSSEEGKYIRVTVAYTDGEGTSESVTASSITISQLHTEWVQPYAAMQNIGLASIKNNRDLVLAKAGECNNYGWVIGDTDYCVYTNANNTTTSVNGNSSYGGYDYAKFNTSINVEKTINDRWKAGLAYGVGSSNLDNYNFSSTTASLSSTNTHYSIYGVKKVSDKFTLKGMIGGSDFDYKGNRNYSTTSATSAYDTDGYTAEINGIWDIKKNIKNMKTPIRLQPTVGVAYAAHTQDGFSESGSGDLVTIDPNQAESILFKTGISIDKQIPMEGGKWILVPSLALNYEMDSYADDDHRNIKGGLTESSTAHTKVSSKTLGQHNGSIKVGADFICTKDFMFNLNAEYGLAEGGDEQSYGGGFRWQF